jgi:hypothetical protein
MGDISDKDDGIDETKGSKRYLTLDDFLTNTKNQTVNALKMTHSGIKKTGYLIADITEAIYYSYADPVIHLRMFFDKEYKHQRKEYKHMLRAIFRDKGRGKFVSNVLAHIAPQPVADENKDTFAYIIGALVVGGYEEWVIDIFADALHLDKQKIIKGSIYGEYINNIISTAQIALVLKAGNFMEKYMTEGIYINSPGFVKKAGDFFKHLNTPEIVMYTTAYGIARYFATFVRMEIYEKKGRYTPSPMRFFTPTTAATSVVLTGATKVAQGIGFYRSHFKDS